MTADKNSKKAISREIADEFPKIVAVIDVGATSVRMAIAQIAADHTIHHLESLTQAVSLGRDTFSVGKISRDTTELCVHAFLNFRHVLREYDIESPAQIMAVATNAVREASNRDTFLDRIYIATGIDVRVIEESEANRFTYLAVQPLLQSSKKLSKQTVMVVEPGAGSMEVLVLRGHSILFSQAFRLGTLRLSKMIDDARASTASRHPMMSNYIGNTVQQISLALGNIATDNLIVLGGDMRFAASQIDPDWQPDTPAVIETSAIENLYDHVKQLGIDQLVMEYNMQYPDAETLVPALLAATTLAREMKRKRILVGNPSLRDGLLYEMANEGAWSDDYVEQICASAVTIGRKYDFDERHARHTTKLALRLFDELQPLHRLRSEYRVILQVAALLHEIGYFISNRGHHKHSMYLIRSSDIFGLSSKQKTVAALIARYHRKALPKSTHPEYEQLRRAERVTVSKLAAILRVATSLDTSRSQRIGKFELKILKDSIEISIAGGGDLSLEQLALRRKGPLFQQVYGRNVVLRSTK